MKPWELDSSAIRAEHRTDQGLPESFDGEVVYGYIRSEGDELVMVPLRSRSYEPVSMKDIAA